MGTLAKARGIIQDDWSLKLFPEDRLEARRRLINWNRQVLALHAVIVLCSIVAGLVTQRLAWLLVPYVLSFSHSFGGWLLFLCNNTQHIGLTDKVPDFRMGARSVKLPLLVSFLYWRMEYHIEHHMYAAVPCYNLPELRKQIIHDLPERKGLVAAWREIATILERQQREPEYQFLQDLPESAQPYQRGDHEHEIEAGEAAPIADDDCNDLNTGEPVEGVPVVQAA
jgi:fatty acid desaturase